MYKILNKWTYFKYEGHFVFEFLNSVYLKDKKMLYGRKLKIKKPAKH